MTKETDMSSTTTSKRRELAYRCSNGIEVWLYWEKVGDMLTLEVYDSTSETYFELEVPKDRALDAFHHPYAYLTASEPYALEELFAA